MPYQRRETMVKEKVKGVKAKKESTDFIRIGDSNYRFRTDNYNWILENEKETKAVIRKGVEYEAGSKVYVIGFFRTFADLVSHLINNEVRDQSNTSSDLLDFLERYEKVSLSVLNRSEQIMRELNEDRPVGNISDSVKQYSLKK